MSEAGYSMSMAAPVRLSLVVTIATCAFALAVACGSSSDSTFGSSGASGGASGDPSSSGGFIPGSSGASGGTSGASGSSGGNCFAPVDMYLMFDRSGSMGEPIGNGAPGDCNIGDTKNSKWCHAINALSGYLNSSSAKEQSAALQFFSGDDKPN